MKVTFQGFVPVPAAGTKVRLSTDTDLRVAQIWFTPVPGATGAVSIGGSTLVASTGVGRMAKIPPAAAAPASAGPQPFVVESCDGSNGLYPADFYLDAAVNGEGLDVTLFQR